MSVLLGALLGLAGVVVGYVLARRRPRPLYLSSISTVPPSDLHGGVHVIDVRMAENYVPPSGSMDLGAS